jgi:hypothetical protein
MPRAFNQAAIHAIMSDSCNKQPASWNKHDIGVVEEPRDSRQGEQTKVK